MKKVKKNNKGFSLVELIVVIAIMAVLMGVLAPQFLRYVEKSRIQRDNSAIGELANATKIAMADEAINEGTATGTTITLVTVDATHDTGFTVSGTDTHLAEELAKTIVVVDLRSNEYSTTKPVLTITKTSEGNVTITGANMSNSDGTTMSPQPTF